VVCAGRSRDDLAQRYRSQAQWLAGTLELTWDGAWYRRAYFDDGTPLGSVQNEECKVDSLTQSWAVLSGAGNRTRAERAMDAVRVHLVRRDAQMVLLLTPPFDRMNHDPGYIKGYLPGVRENGAQYTHAAAWCVIAFALERDGDRAFELFAMLNPINHASTRGGAHRYKIEPYVVAGDVYSEPPHVGRGGWSWYTGAAGWLYRAGVEYILGIRVHADRVEVAPCIPRDWPGYTVRYRRGGATYVIRVDNPLRISTGDVTISVDGDPVRDRYFTPVDDGREHRVDVVLREPGAAIDELAAEAGAEPRVAGLRA